VNFQVALEGGLPEVAGDRDRLEQVLDNLMSSALKLTSRGSITLQARAAGTEVHIVVADTGSGVEQADQERIFGKFQQVGQVLRDKPRGTGLGLAICWEIVPYHGGRIWVSSRPGSGSVFTVALPVASDQPLIAA
jgi:signal transduction histidine kinase